MYVALEYPRWQQLVLVRLRELCDKNEGAMPPNKEVLEELKSIAEIKPFMKKVMPFVAAVKVMIYSLCGEALMWTLLEGVLFTEVSLSRSLHSLWIL